MVKVKIRDLTPFILQIEDLLPAHEAIKDEVVIGLPGPRLGVIPAAIIELKPGFSCSEADIEQFWTSLPRYKRPRKIIFENVPRNTLFSPVF